MQRDLYKNLNERGYGSLRCHIYLKKISLIIKMQKQMIMIRAPKENRVMHVAHAVSTAWAKGAIHNNLE